MTRWMSLVSLVSLVVLGGLSGCADARAPEELLEPSEPPPARVGAIEDQLFSAELVMDHQAALGLDDAQESAIRGVLQAAQAELVDAEWALRREREAFAALLAGERVDEAAALEAAGRVVAREGSIKLIHLRLLVRIKNALTPEQQRRLDALRRR